MARRSSRPGPSSPRISHRSARTTARVSHGAAATINPPAANAANVPARVATCSTPNGVSTGTGLSRTLGGWLRNHAHHSG